MGFWRSAEEKRRDLESARTKIKRLVEQHIDELAQKRMKGIRQGDYGSIDATRWIKEGQKFFDQVVKPALTEYEREAIVKAGLTAIATELLEDRVRQRVKLIESKQNFDPKLSPVAYENFCAGQLQKLGWECTTTKTTGDQGADVIAKKNGRILVVQCKKYSSSVGNAAVQEVIAAKRFFNAHYAAVITNSTYTKSAIELATVANVMLLNHTEIPMIEKRIRLLGG